MAIAGKVAITLGGEWSESTAYEKLVMVTYNKNAYVSRKPSTGILPTNEEYWMLTIENVTAEDLSELQAVTDALISGTTPSGNSTLHSGYTAKEVGQSGARNLIPYPHYEATKTSNGIEWTDNGDGTVTANGTATATSYFTLINRTQPNPVGLQNDTYTASGTPNGGSASTYFIQFGREVNGVWSRYGNDYGEDLTVEITDSPTKIQITIVIMSGVTVENLTFKPMLEHGSIAHNFVPYHIGGAEDALALQGMDIPEFVSNENLLINADFKNPVNSSWLTEWSKPDSNMMSIIDKWLLEGVSGTTASLGDEGITLNKAFSGPYVSLVVQSTSHGISKKLEIGKKYTVSVKADGVEYSLTFTGGTYLPGGAVFFKQESGAAALSFFYTSSDDIYVRSYVDTITIEWIKLEPSSIATPFIPPNKEMEKLKCGVANEHLVAAYPQSNASISDTFTIQDLLNKRTVTFFTNWKDSTNFPFVYANGVVIPGFDTSISTILYARANTGATIHKVFIGLAKKTDGVWAVTWSNAADGGNADTVDGCHVSELVKLDDTNTSEISRSNNIPVVVANKTSGATTSVIGFKNAGDGVIGYLGFTGKDAPAYISADKSVVKSLLHSGNFSSVALPLDGSVPMSGALRIDSGTGLDGGRLTLAGSETGTLTSDLKFDVYNNRVRFYTEAADGSGLAEKRMFFPTTGSVEILDTGNSAKVSIGSSAPSDTTALWYDTANKICKQYVYGAWQA